MICNNRRIRMKPSRELVDAFRSAAERIRQHPNDWVWGAYGSCNLGILAQELGLSKETLDVAGDTCIDWEEFGDFWASQVDIYKYCPDTNTSVGKVIKTLYQKGIEPQDLGHIEKAVIPEGTIEHEYEAQCLVGYFLDMASKLEKELLASKTNTYKTVSVEE